MPRIDEQILRVYPGHFVQPDKHLSNYYHIKPKPKGKRIAYLIHSGESGWLLITEEPERLNELRTLVLIHDLPVRVYV